MGGVMRSVRALWVLGAVACGADEPKPQDSSTETTETTATGTETGTVPTTETTETTPPTVLTTDTGVADPLTVPLDGPCPLETDFGGFTTASDAFMTTTSGAVANGVVPITVLEQVAAEADCVLLQQNIPFCDPACGPNETCDFDGTCLPFPLQQDQGVVTVEGLIEPLEMEPSEPGFNYYTLGQPHPAYAPGALVTLHATGGADGPYTLHGVGLEPLESVVSDWVLVAGQDLPITWAPPAAGARSTMRLVVTIDQHGATPVRLECEFPDTGAAVVPGALVDQFVGFGVTGFPSATMTRRTVDSTTLGAGCVDFALSWNTTADLTVQGFTPCKSDLDCPSGQTCDVRNEICE